MRDTSFINKSVAEHKLAIGIMTGTSLDAVDSVLVRIRGTGIATEYSIERFESYPFDEGLVGEIRSAIASGTVRLDRICEINYAIPALYARAVGSLCAGAGVSPDSLDFIAISGQTFWHAPGKATLQIGDGAFLAGLLGVPVVWDFRAPDIAAKGQGAPLVPYLDYIIYSKYNINFIPLNIGGISNLSMIPAGGGFDSVTAFDCGPGNMIMDRLVIEMTGGAMRYDRDSAIAMSGRVSRALMDMFMSHPYLSKAPPKSTGREDFGDGYTARAIEFVRSRGISMPDAVCTATEFTARCVADCVTEWCAPRFGPAGADGADPGVMGRMILDTVSARGDGPVPVRAVMPCAGGGAKNPLLMARLRESLAPHGVCVTASEDVGVDPASKEALLMAVLGNESVYGMPSNVPSATGASRRVVTGTVSYQRRG